MSKLDRTERSRQTVAGASPQHDDVDTALGCQAGNLKGLLDSIVTQISDADKRHSITLHQMQDRLHGLGEDARALRGKVPSEFQHAFERIESGMAELSKRISGMSGSLLPEALAASAAPSAGVTALNPHDVPAPLSVAQPQPQQAETHEPPVALRSAQSPETQRRAAEPLAKFHNGVDTFDVIESIPGDVSEPWDRDAADALATVYDTTIPAYDDNAYSAPHVPQAPRVYASPAASHVPLPGEGVHLAANDHDWLEKRFSEIAERIEASLADIRPDQSFFALGQRFDQFEKSFADAMENVATRHDLDSVRLIENHMAELVTHLENTHLQMTRLETIETQLAAISERLDGAPLQGGAFDPAGFPDIAEVARAAAHETAARFADVSAPHDSSAALDDMRQLIERSMTDARQSEENTTALLDTLQQAMIRLLDRMDAIELSHHQEAQKGAAPVHAAAFAPRERDFADDEDTSYSAPAPRSDSVSSRINAISGRNHHTAADIAAPQPFAPGAIENAVAGVAAQNAQRQSRPRLDLTDDDVSDPLRVAPRPSSRAAAEVPSAERNPEKVRQDFIAEARRAKLRLASEEGSDQIVLTNASAAPPAAEDLPPSQRPVGKVVKSDTDKNRSNSILTPRAAALAIALVVAGGAYLLLPGKGPQQANMAAPPAISKDVKPAGADAAGKKAEAKPAAKAAGAQKAAPGEAPPPDASFEKRSEVPDGLPKTNDVYSTVGQIIADDVNANTASVTLPGVAVATKEDVTAAELARAHRQNAMASISGKLGEAAGQFAPPVSPVALLPAQQAETAPEKVTERRTGGALDLPPATVGPLSLRLAAANGDPSAEFEVGARLAEGKGTEQNFKEAAKWYQRSAAKGFVQAQYRIGTLYERGLGLKADEDRAKDWYRRAAEQGNVKSMHNLAVLSANNKKGAPDYAVAAKWFGEAAEHGLADSQFNLAVLYENGLGVTGDMRQAYKWLYLAARNGDKEAVRRRDILKGKLTADELTQAEELIRAYQPRANDPMANDARTAGESWKRNPANGESG